MIITNYYYVKIPQIRGELKAGEPGLSIDTDVAL